MEISELSYHSNTFRPSEFWFFLYELLHYLRAQMYPNKKFKTLEIAKMAFFERLHSQNWFHVKSESQKNSQIFNTCYTQNRTQFHEKWSTDLCKSISPFCSLFFCNSHLSCSCCRIIHRHFYVKSILNPCKELKFL